MSRSLSLDSSKMRAQVSGLKEQLGRKYAITQERVTLAAREVARRAAVALAMRTFPAIGAYVHYTKLSIAYDIRQVFISPSNAFEILKSEVGENWARRFYAAYKRGNIQLALDVLRQSGSSLAGIGVGPIDPEMHQAARSGYRQHVKLKTPLRIVPADRLAAYIKKVQMEVGKAAAGWSACAVILGGEDGVPYWKSAAFHGKDGGEVHTTNEATRAGITLINRVPHIRRLISGGQIAAIQNQARADLLAELKNLSLS